MENVIEIEHLTKYYGKHRGVSDVSFRVKEGDIFGFLGPNGAGKSTTIRSMLGFLKFREGSIKILGMDSVKDHEDITANPQSRTVAIDGGHILYFDNLASLVNEIKNWEHK